MIIVYLLLLAFFSFVLIRLNNTLILHLRELDGNIKLGGFAVTSVFLALATSLPEIFVAITSAFEGIPSVSLGDVIGSNITNLSLVAGLAAVVGGTVKIKNGTTSEDLLHAFVAGAAPLLLLLDHTLSRLDALLLISLYGFYDYTILSRRTRGYEKEEEWVVARFWHRLKPRKTQKKLAVVILTIAGILLASDLIVKLSRQVATGLNVPIFLIGLFIVSLGTSLPELGFELEAVRKGEASMFLGNLIGSTVTNGTLVIGIAALIHPIEIAAFSEYFLASLFFVLIFLLFYIFTKTEQKLERWEGGVLIMVYLFFLFLEVIQ